MPGRQQGRASLGLRIRAYLALFARVLWRIGDEGMIVHGAQRVLEGQVPYVDFVEAIAPGSFYWLAGYFKLFGTSWFALRTHLVLSGAAISALIYYLTRFLIPGRFAVVPCALFTVLGVPLWTASSHHWDSLMFSLVATACFLEWQRHGRPVLLSVSGVSAAVTTCIMPQKGGALLVALVAILVVSRYAHSTFPVGSHIRRLAVPYALTLAGCVLCLMYAGALAAAFEATVVWPLTQYQSINRLPYAWGALTLPIGRSLSLLPSTPAVLIGTAAFVSFWCFLTVVLLPVLAPLLLVVAYRRGTNATVLRDPPLLSALAIGYAMWLGELQRPDFYHLMWGSPVLLVAVFVLLARGVSPTLRTATCWALCLSIVVVGTINVAITLDARETLSTRRGTMRAFNSDPALSFVMANVRPGEPVFVYPYYRCTTTSQTSGIPPDTACCSTDSTRRGSSTRSSGCWTASG